MRNQKVFKEYDLFSHRNTSVKDLLNILYDSGFFYLTDPFYKVEHTPSGDEILVIYLAYNQHSVQFKIGSFLLIQDSRYSSPHGLTAYFENKHFTDSNKFLKQFGNRKVDLEASSLNKIEDLGHTNSEAEFVYKICDSLLKNSSENYRTKSHNAHIKIRNFLSKNKNKLTSTNMEQYIYLAKCDYEQFNSTEIDTLLDNPLTVISEIVETENIIEYTKPVYDNTTTERKKVFLSDNLYR